MWNHSFRKANISLGVAAAVMAIELLVFGSDPTALEYQAIVWVPFAVGLLTLFMLYEREDRASRAQGSKSQNAVEE